MAAPVENGRTGRKWPHRSKMTESLRIITAGGDPYAMGRAIGAAVADAVRDRVLGHQEFRAAPAS